MKLWMKVSKDEYELPEMVCGSLGELSRRTGVRKDTIRNEFYYAQKVGIPCRFARVIVEDWGEDEQDIKVFFEEVDRNARKKARRRKRLERM